MRAATALHGGGADEVGQDVVLGPADRRAGDGRGRERPAGGTRPAVRRIPVLGLLRHHLQQRQVARARAFGKGGAVEQASRGARCAPDPWRSRRGRKSRRRSPRASSAKLRLTDPQPLDEVQRARSVKNQSAPSRVHLQRFHRAADQGAVVADRGQHRQRPVGDQLAEADQIGAWLAVRSSCGRGARARR